MRKLKLLIAACALLSAAAMQAKTDVTSTYLTNAGLTSLTGWTIDTGFGGNGYTDWKTDGDVPVIEFYHTWGSNAGAAIGTTKTFNFSQKANLPAGYYRLAVNAFYREGNGNGTNTKAYIYAGTDYQQYVVGLSSAGVGAYSGSNDLYKAANAFSLGNFSNEFDFQVTEAGEVEIGFHGYIDTYCSWCILGPVTLWEYTVEDYYTDYDTKYATAQELLNSPMNAEAKSALQAAMVDKTTLTTVDEAKAAINVLGTAITNAQSSVNSYATANVSAYISKMKGVLDNTNVYTTEAYNKWYGEVENNYTNGLYTDGEVVTLTEAGAFSTGWHSTNHIDDVLLSTWSIDNVPCGDYTLPLYINTWSVEGNTDGSEFYAPFFEYWVDAAQVLAAKTFTSTITGLEANQTYSFTIRARVQPTNGQTMIDDAILLQVGSGDPVNIAGGTKFGSTNYYIGNFSAVGQTDSEGTLTVTITVAENSNISWLSFYNCKYTQGEDLSAYIADYEFALSTAKANNENTAYAAVTGKERSDLEAALTTYATVDETDKATLIAAKEALETASNTFVAAASVYNAFAELNTNVAATLGVTLPTISSTTTAADLNVESIIVAEYTAAKAFAEDYTSKLGEWTDAPGTNKGESWDGTTNDTYYDLYNSAARAMTQTVTLPAGYYALIAKGRASVNGRLTLTVGEEAVTFPHKSSTGRGIATDGTATFADDATYANSNNGRGWEYRVMTFTSDGVTPTTLTFDWTTANSNWCGLDDIELLCNPVTVTSAYLAGSFNEWSTDALEMEQVGETYSYACELDIEDLADVTFKPVINGNWMAFGQFTMDESNPDGWLEDAGDSDNHNIKLNNSTTGYKTYTVTATWTPSLDVTAGWTLKIEGKDERTKNTYTVNFVKGWNDWSTVYAYAWNDNGAVTAAWPGEEMTASTDTKYGYTIYTLSFDSYAAPTKVQFNDGTDYHKIDNLDFTDGMTYEGVTFEDFTVTEAGWATAKTTNNVTFTDVEGLKAYIATLSGTTVILTEATTVPANTPIVLKGESAKAAVVGTADAVANNALTWYDNYTVNDSHAHIYALTIDKNDGKAKFARVKDGQTFYNKAVIELVGATARESLNVIFADETTGINAVVAENAAEGIYNMNGQRVTTPAKGLYIVNGKKVVLK